MINELKLYGGKLSWPQIRCCPGIFLEKFRKTTKILRITLSGPIFESGTSRIQVRCGNHSAETFNKTLTTQFLVTVGVLYSFQNVEHLLVFWFEARDSSVELLSRLDPNRVSEEYISVVHT